MLKYLANFFFIIVGVLTISLASCAVLCPCSTRDNQMNDDKIPVGHCRITGTIVSIDSASINKTSSGPCSKAPCRATVRVDSVHGYGAAFGAPLAISKNIIVEFAFTLHATTKDLFPNLDTYYPGLSIGSPFIADVESQVNKTSTDDNRNEKITYKIYHYQVVN